MMQVIEACTACGKNMGPHIGPLSPHTNDFRAYHQHIVICGECRAKWDAPRRLQLLAAVQHTIDLMDKEPRSTWVPPVAAPIDIQAPLGWNHWTGLPGQVTACGLPGFQQMPPQESSSTTEFNVKQPEGDEPEEEEIEHFVHPGDVVQLCSGGPKMTVSDYIRIDSVRCRWFVNDEIRDEIFSEESLVLMD